MIKILVNIPQRPWMYILNDEAFVEKWEDIGYDQEDEGN